MKFLSKILCPEVAVEFSKLLSFPHVCNFEYSAAFVEEFSILKNQESIFLANQICRLKKKFQNEKLMNIFV